MPSWLWLIVAYLIGSFFPVTRITGMFAGMGKSTGGTAKSAG